jgi:hypothetical protein
MRRIEISGEITGHDANQASDLSRSAARGTSVIPFVRRANAAASVGLAGAVETSSAAPFIELGNAVASVVMNLRGGFPRILVLAPVGAGEDYDDWDEL